jgi:cell wall-associated NlpC family hydrolase
MRKTLSAILVISACLAMPAHADETPAQLPPLPATPLASPATEAAAMAASPLAAPSPSLMSRAVSSVEGTIERALDFIGLRYKRGGSSPETGFDCSGFVRYVYNETLGLVLPHNAKAIAQEGERVEKSELKPGDLVFFNTMRRAFSHVGIYLGDNLFVHAPRSGARVRIEDMTDRYWSRRYNGARRIQP